MKYTTKQLMSMTQAERTSICGNMCETKYCPFKKSLWKYREDGYCIAETYERVNNFIGYDEDYLKRLKSEYERKKQNIKNRKRELIKLQRIINKEIEE